MAEKKNKKKEEKLGWQKNTMLYAHDLMYLLLIVMLLFLLVFRIIVVSGGSMKMTLLDGDYLLLLSNTFYHKPEQGDVVVISKESFDDGKPIVKRVIATEGQTVDIDFVNGIVYVDDIPLEEDYINALTTVDGGVSFPLTVAEGCIFVLGDNRGISLDSRYPEVGQIDKREVLGKAILLMYPGTDEGNYPKDFDRVGAVR
ncbi:MAG: signal peptidase I [Faecousia sp.]